MTGTPTLKGQYPMPQKSEGWGPLTLHRPQRRVEDVGSPTLAVPEIRILQINDTQRNGG
jgi:hypothetical protein